MAKKSFDILDVSSVKNGTKVTINIASAKNTPKFASWKFVFLVPTNGSFDSLIRAMRADAGMGTGRPVNRDALNAIAVGSNVAGSRVTYRHRYAAAAGTRQA